MSEQKLRDAFDHMGPDEATRQRMLENILAAHAAEADESAAQEATACLVTAQVTTAPGTVAQEVTSQKKPGRRARKFSLLRYALPLAACLILAAVIPPVLPQLVAVFEVSASQSSENSPEYSVSDSAQTAHENVVSEDTHNESPFTQLPGNQGPSGSESSGSTTSSNESTIAEPPLDATGNPPEDNVTDIPAPSVVSPTVITAPPAAYVVVSDQATPSHNVSESDTYLAAPPFPTHWPSTVVDYVSLALSVLACLIALAIAIMGIINWRRKKQK